MSTDLQLQVAVAVALGCDALWRTIFSALQRSFASDVSCLGANLIGTR